MTSPSPSASTPRPEQAPGATAPRRAPHELLGLTSPAYGGDYNPEQWDEATFAEDLELITGCPVLGQVPTDRVLAKRLALGEDPVRARSAFRRAASALARELLHRLADAAAPVNRSVSQTANQSANRSLQQSDDQFRRRLWSR